MNLHNFGDSYALYLLMHSLKALIAKGESQFLEFKFEVNSARDISETLSAFANSDGGTILIGVKDNGVIAGIRLEEELYVLEAAADMYCKPSLKPVLKRWDIDGKSVLEVIIAEHFPKPVLSESQPGNWRAWIRIGASNRLASPIHLRLWQMGKNQEPPPSTFSEKEKTILDLFNQKKWMSLNQVSKFSRLPRYQVIRCLADFTRWELIECEPEASGGYVFTLRDDLN
jgi:predicted HTH transcriptional regulator